MTTTVAPSGRSGTGVVDCPEIIELDVNPVLACEHRVVAADCRVVLAATGTVTEPAGP